MSKKTVILGITGGIAAIRIPQLITMLKKDAVGVLPIMTRSAGEILDPKVVERAAGQRVYTDLFPRGFGAKTILSTRVVDHIALAQEADLIVVTPATANILGKVACGMADDFLTTTILAATCPVVFYPSMNVHMWNSAAVQDNVQCLRDRGYIVSDPVSGRLACGDRGVGRLPEVAVIAREIMDLLGKKELLRGKTILITAGGRSSLWMRCGCWLIAAAGKWAWLWRKLVMCLERE